MDPYTLAASEWFNTPEELVTIDQRQEIKRVFFQISFGGGVKVASLRKITPERKKMLQDIYKQFDNNNANMLYSIRAFPYND